MIRIMTKENNVSELREVGVSEHYIERSFRYKKDQLFVGEHPDGVTIVKVMHPEFWVDAQYPTDTYYGSSFSSLQDEHPRNLKVFCVMKYATDYWARLPELGKGDFIYVLHRIGEDECPNRYTIVRNARKMLIHNSLSI